MGTTFHLNSRFAYQLTSLIEPFAAVDYFSKGADSVGGTSVVGSNPEEFALGGGIMFHFTPKISLTMRYSYGIDGSNTNQTNAGYLKFVYLF
jgi:hypothetical protein